MLWQCKLGAWLTQGRGANNAGSVAVAAAKMAKWLDLPKSRVNDVSASFIGAAALIV
jgi:hypothetical protein